MSQSTSPSTGKVYGLHRVCKAWDVSRSAWYERRKPSPSRRGRPPVVADDKVLEQIRQEISDSPFKGEGHKKIHHRLRSKGLVVGRNRVCQLMRDAQLLSPWRAHSTGPREHKGRIITDRPDAMWATDGLKVMTAQDGWVWVFPVVDHWNSECVGFHICKKGDRFAALEAVAAALRHQGRGTGAGAATGIKLRADHGCQYTSEGFRRQIAAWGFETSYALVRQPETNGVVERFNRTLQEQAIYGRVIRDIAEVRELVAAFVGLYNNCWQIARLGYQTPTAARLAYGATAA